MVFVYNALKTFKVNSLEDNQINNNRGQTNVISFTIIKYLRISTIPISMYRQKHSSKNLYICENSLYCAFYVIVLQGTQDYQTVSWKRKIDLIKERQRSSNTLQWFLCQNF